MSATTSVCYLSYDFSITPTPEGTIQCPEALLNGDQIKRWVSGLIAQPKCFATSSLYLIRELYLQGVPVTYVNYTPKGKFSGSDLSEISDIEVLDRDLLQSEVYLDKSASSNLT